MKYIFIILILFINLEIMAKQISELNWKKRLLLVSYQNEDDLIFNESTKFISDNKCQIDDRNLEIIFFENFENKQYITPDFIEDKYGIWLIGYDGNIKDYEEDDKILLRLFDIIDSMPMRKNEIVDDQC
tara:strand:+ start:3158 stop:3544 length:387 start_codon:yes stop_codon:yes gene_type:complete